MSKSIHYIVFESKQEQKQNTTKAKHDKEIVSRRTKIDASGMIAASQLAS